MTGADIALALAIGIAMGLFGGGGSLLLVPAFNYLLEFDAKQAVAMSLAVVGISAAAGSIVSLAQGALLLRHGLVIGATTVIGAFGGSAVGVRLDDQLQLRLFGLVVIVAAIALGSQAVMRERPARPVKGRAVLAAAGLGVGFMTGLLGVGGGFLIVPALVLGANLDIRDATSVSLFVIVLATLSAFVTYAGAVAMPWSYVLPFAAVASAGTIAGGQAGRSISPRLLQRVFAAGLIVVAAAMLLRG